MTADNKLKSTINTIYPGTITVCSRFVPTALVSHPWTSNHQGFNYNPERIVRLLEDTFKESSKDKYSFFVFVNLFDTHHPYSPPPDLQKKHLGRVLPHRELEELADLSQPFNFASRVATGNINEDQVEMIRDLYAAEVESSDRHLYEILNLLESYDLGDETLIIIVGDHGENLSEEGPFEDQMMAHGRSGSHASYHVPLVLIHPDLETLKRMSPFNVRHIYHILKRPDDFIADPVSVIESHSNEMVVSQTPVASRISVLAESYPAVPDRIIKRSIVVGYDDDWRIVLSD